MRFRLDRLPILQNSPADPYHHRQTLLLSQILRSQLAAAHHRFQNFDPSRAVRCMPSQLPLMLSAGLQAVIAAAFCPRLFRLPPGQANYGGLAELPYSMVFALATLDSVLVYSTLVSTPATCADTPRNPLIHAGCRWHVHQLTGLV